MRKMGSVPIYLLSATHSPPRMRHPPLRRDASRTWCLPSSFPAYGHLLPRAEDQAVSVAGRLLEGVL